MEVDKAELKKVLLKTESLTEDQFAQAEEISRVKNKDLEDVLVEERFITDEHLGAIIADIRKYPFINLRQENISQEVLRQIPEKIARKQILIAFKKEKDKVRVAMLNPDDLDIIRLLEKELEMPVTPYYATKRDIKEAFVYYRRNIKKEFRDIIKKNVQETVKSKDIRSEQVSVVKIVDTLLHYAYETKASDIHFEPHENNLLVRFRIDGILHDIVTLPKNIHDPLTSRIKIMARLRTDEHAAAQDGRFRETIGEEKVAIRVSVVPIYDGEKIVLRLLYEEARAFALNELGFAEANQKILKRNFQKPYGMLLVVGPTGSGKTTTLYAILKILNRREVNISTIEDPIEYDIEGVNQIQVNTRTNLTFAKGLRAIIRQDPDIIMVGEIRDEETADIAVNAAMTGHLVLSTLHANDAATAIPRLMDMNIEPFLIASTVNAIVSQRLVRKIHTRCIATHTLSEQERNYYGELFNKGGIDINKEGIRFYKGEGCETDNFSGYSGRTGIFEILEISDKVRELIMKKADADEIKKAAQKAGMTTMIQDGFNKMEQGITTIEEVLRVTRE